MRAKRMPQKIYSSCLICLDDYRSVELQSLHEKHRLHLVCRDCLDTLLVSFVNVLKCPLCRIPVDNVYILSSVNFVDFLNSLYYLVYGQWC